MADVGFRQRKCQPEGQRRHAGEGHLGGREGELRRRCISVRQRA